MKNALFLFLYVSALFLASCSGRQGGVANLPDGVSEEILYAEGFSVTHCNGYSKVDIVNPWDTTSLLQTYFLVERDKDVPKNLPQGVVVKVPVQNAVMYTTVHTSILEELGALDAIAAICEPEYLTSEAVKKKVEAGEIIDSGKAASPNVEKIIDANAEIIIASPFEHGGYGQVEKLQIPIFEAADYMENHPLGRVEWLKLFGMLTGKKEVADSMFNSIVENYNYYKNLVANVEKRPRLLVERKYGSSWMLPGGASYMVKMYKDAGADYIFAEDKETGSVPYAFESVYEVGVDADIWVLKYAGSNPLTYKDLASEFEPYARFAPFKNRKIFTCNTVTTPYYEYVSIHPDYILADLVYVFHPNLMPEGYQPKCFKPMDE